MKRLEIIVCLLFIGLFHNVNGQDEKMLNVSLVGGVTPAFYSKLTTPLSIIGDISYKVNPNISAGIFYQSASGNNFFKTCINCDSEKFNKITISQIGLLGRYYLGSSGSKIRPYGIISLGITSMKQEIDKSIAPFNLLSPAGLADFTSQFEYDESYFTFGAGIGAEYKIQSSLSVTMQVVSYDIASSIGDEIILFSSTDDEIYNMQITNGYLFTDNPFFTKKYVPFYINIGIAYSFINKKL